MRNKTLLFVKLVLIIVSLNFAVSIIEWIDRDCEILQNPGHTEVYIPPQQKNVDIRLKQTNRIEDKLSTVNEFRDRVIEILPGNETYADKYSMAALLYFTSVVESLHGEYLTQLGGGPALGMFQIEPRTHDDLFKHYFKYNPRQRSYVLSFKDHDRSNNWNLKNNVDYSILIAYYVYTRRDKGCIPNIIIEADTVHKKAVIWKDVYNTYKGKGDVDRVVRQYNDFENNINK